MSHVFLSYTEQSTDCAKSIGAALTALGARVLDYRSPSHDTAIDAVTTDRIMRDCQSATFFVQLVEGGLGTVAVDGTSLMELELDWYLGVEQENHNRRSRPLVLNLPPSTHRTDAHIQKYSAAIETVLCENKYIALEVVTGWYNRRRVLEAELRAIAGHMDLEIADQPVDKALSNAIHLDALIPQRLLYTSPFGALLWRRLSSNRNSSVRRVYDIIDFSSASTESVAHCIRQISTWDYRHPVSLIALGCGDGRREAMLADALIRVDPGRRLRVLLVDISKTLIAMAAREFSGLADRRNLKMSLSFALADFEHPTTMSALMRQWSPDAPVIIAFLGNIFGNIDFASFMESVRSAMKADDLLLTEVGLAVDSVAPGSDGGRWVMLSPQHDDRFDFLTGPVRQLGVRPLAANFRVRTHEEALFVRRTYAYHFDDNEADTVRSLLNIDNKPRKVALLRVDSFKRDALFREVSKTFGVVGGAIAAYSASWRQNVPQMGLFLAKRS